jgi:hypothetical protein
MKQMEKQEEAMKKTAAPYKEILLVLTKMMEKQEEAMKKQDEINAVMIKSLIQISNSLASIDQRLNWNEKLNISEKAVSVMHH